MLVRLTLLLLFVHLSCGDVDTINLCDTSDIVDYENYTTTVTQNCGCKKDGLCVRKCCQKGFYHEHDEDPDIGLFISVCIKNEYMNETVFSVPIHNGTTKVNETSEDFKIGTLVCNNTDFQYFKMDKTDPRQKFYIQENGSLYYPYYEKMYSNDRYCLDDQDGLTAYLCRTPQPEVNQQELLIHILGKLIPVPFLAITWLVYAVLPEKNLHRNALMNHVLCLIPGNILFAIGQYKKIEESTPCLLLGFSILYFMVASFFWMNVICIDIWLAFSGIRGFYVQEKLKKKILILASLYAWGLPGINALVAYFLNTYIDENSFYYPGIGFGSCFLTETATIVYYFGPIIILIAINIILFILTSINIQKAKEEAKIVRNTENMKHSNVKDDRFRLYWKLLFVMGLNPVVNTHVIQLISWSFGQDIQREIALGVWYFKDCAHALYGIIVFLIFVCQKKILISLKERFKCIYKSNKNNSKSSLTTSSCTSSTENCTAVRLRNMQNIPPEGRRNEVA